MNTPLSQSMLRSFQDYLNNAECGIVFRAKYIDHTYPDQPTESQAGGHWFEYACTGATPRNSGIAPEPVKIKSGDYNVMYRVLDAQVKNFKVIEPAEYKAGEVLNATMNGIELTGIADLVTEAETIDIKTTGFIDNRWETYGWGGELAEKQHMFQAKFYTLIRWLNDGVIRPFYFYLFSNKNEMDYRIIRVEISEDTLHTFSKEVETLAGLMDYHIGVGLEPLPEYKRCAGCPLAELCSHKAMTPEVEIVKL